MPPKRYIMSRGQQMLQASLCSMRKRDIEMKKAATEAWLKNTEQSRSLPDKPVDKQSSRPTDITGLDAVTAQQSCMQTDTPADITAVDGKSLEQSSGPTDFITVDAVNVEQSPVQTDTLADITPVDAEPYETLPYVTPHANSVTQSDMPESNCTVQVDPVLLGSCKYCVTIQVKRSDGSIPGVLTLYHSFSDVADALNNFMSIQADVEEITVIQNGNNEFYADAAYATSESDDNAEAPSSGPRSKKRVIRPENWKRNKNKVLRQSGKAYSDVTGKVRCERKVNTIRCTHSKTYGNFFGCCEFYDDQDDIHSQFWSLKDEDKGHFFARTTKRCTKKRTRVKTQKSSTRKFSFQFFFYRGEEKVQVCRQFYLRTLNISAKRIEYYYKHRINQETGTPLPLRHGKHVKKRIPSDARQSARDHINSYPRVESHYCRASTTRQYLDSTLSVEKMYRMYCENYTELPPVSLHMYREIFNTEFNLSFHVPKKDRCDYCEEYRTNISPSEEDAKKYSDHEKSKFETKNERDGDRHKQNKSHAVVCFDLENVICLPRANIKSFFFRRKLSVYNLTAHCSVDNRAYCAVWCEGSRNRCGNDIASALVAILEKVIAQNPGVLTITLWSDACVPQNKNSAMSFAILTFLKSHANIQKIVQKFGTPGHSPVQEVDNVHSQIEQRMRKTEVHSPVALLRLLKQVSMRKPFVVIEMSEGMFFDFQSKAKAMAFRAVPFTKVCEINYTQSKVVSFKESFSDTSPVSVTVITSDEMPAAKNLPYKPQLSGDKAKDMKAMLKYMPNADKEYYTTLLTMNDSEFETSDATNEQRMVDEVPMPLPAEAQCGRMTRQRVVNRDTNKDATKDTTVLGAVKKKSRKANPRTLKTSVPLPAEAQSGRMTRKRVADSDKTKDATKDTTVPAAVKKKPRKANPRTLKTPVPLPAEEQSGRMTRKRVADSNKTKDATKDTTVPGAVKKKPRKANPRTLKTPVPPAAEARSG